MRETLRRISYWLKTTREQARLDEEMRLHIALREEQLERNGMSQAEAAKAARRRFGNQLQMRERSQEIWISRWIEDIFRDIRVGSRGLTRNPGFTVVAVLTLALGIGANTAIFSVVKAVLLEPLAYEEPDRIVAVQTLQTKTNRRGNNISGGDYADLVAEPSPFMAATRYNGGELPIETGGQAEFVGAYGIDAGFADVFQLKPIAGRLITREEFRTKATVAMVSETFAVRHFGERHRAIDETLRSQQSALSIVGVLPTGFRFPRKAEVWFPMPWEITNRTSGIYKAVARLKPGVTAEAASAHLATVGARLQEAFPSTHKHKSFTATLLKDVLIKRSRLTLWLLMGSVGLVLLVACANVANLLLARATARSREMALRTALGAGGRRLVSQLLVESTLLGLVGGAIGFALAFAGVGALLHLAPANLPRLDEIRVDLVALLFNLVVSLGAVALFGLWPALRAARIGVNEALSRGGTRGVLGGGRTEWVRGALVSAEVALALVLTLGAGLLFRSFLALNAVELGYQTEGRLVLTASIPAKTEAQYLQAGATFERIFAALQELPGVSAAAGVMGLPSGPYGSDGLYAVEGMHDFRSAQYDELPHAGFRLTSPGYFGTMGTPLIAGRDFDERDRYDAEPVAIVSATLVRQLFEGQSPLGRHIKCGLDRDEWMRVVGVVGDMRNNNPATPPRPELYMAYRQHPYHANDLHIVVHAQGDVSTAARKTIVQIDPGIPLKVSTMEQFHSNSVALPRFRTLLLIVFAGLAAALATVGVYGVMSYQAAQRQPEMGVRIALGASRGNIVSILVGSGAKLAGVGLACGLAISLVAGRLMESMLYDISPRDPLAIGGTILLLSGATLLAALIPALRASQVDPALALREE